MSAESARPTDHERLQRPDELVGLYARLLLAHNDLMDPDKEFSKDKERHVKRHLNKRNYEPFERTSEYDRKAFWKKQAQEGKVKEKSEQYKTWEESIINGMNKKTSAQKRNDVFYPLFERFGIEKDANNQQFTADDAKKLYDHYFSKEKDPQEKGVKQFVKDVLATHTENGKVNMNKLKQDLPDLKKLAIIFGEESAAMVEQLIMAEAKLKTEPNFIKKLPNSRKNNLKPEERRILSHIKEVYEKEKVAKAQALEGLPLMGYDEEISEAIRTKKRLLLIGGTGCGKTVGFPFITRRIMQEERDLGRDPGKFVITEPTVINTDSLAKKIAGDGVATLGEEVDFQHGQREGSFNREADTVLMTQGSLINMFLRNDDYVRSMQYLMIDEAHILSTDTVLLMAFAKKEQERREQTGEAALKIFVASATIDEAKFQKYLEVDEVMKIPGKIQKIEDTFAPESVDIPELPQVIAKEIEATIAGGEHKDILAFVPGKPDIESTINAINDTIREKGLKQYGDIMPPMGLHSQSKEEDKTKATQPHGDDERRIVAATNFAETGLTMVGLTLVLDTGLKKEMVYNPKTRSQQLMTVKASRDECMQRRGRVGRVEAGEFRPLYTEADFNGQSTDGTGQERPPHIIPEIVRSDLKGTILKLKRHGQDIRNLDLLYGPEAKQLDTFEEDLIKMGALKREGNTTSITEIGKVMEEVSRNFEDVHHQRMIAEATLHHPEMLDDVCAMIALDKSFIFKREKGKPSVKRESLAAFHKYASDLIDPESDFTTLLNTWEAFQSVDEDQRQEWADERGLNQDELRNIEDKKKRLIETAKASPVKVQQSQEPLSMKTLVAKAYADRVMIYKNGSYVWEADQEATEGIHLEIGDQSVMKGEHHRRILVGSTYIPDDGKERGFLSSCQVVTA